MMEVIYSQTPAGDDIMVKLNVSHIYNDGPDKGMADGIFQIDEDPQEYTFRYNTDKENGEVGIVSIVDGGGNPFEFPDMKALSIWISRQIFGFYHCHICGNEFIAYPTKLLGCNGMDPGQHPTEYIPRQRLVTWTERKVYEAIWEKERKKKTGGTEDTTPG